MKQGSTDDPFAEDPDDATLSPDAAGSVSETDSSGADAGSVRSDEQPPENARESTPSRSDAGSDLDPDGSPGGPADGADVSDEQPHRRQSLPYIHARDDVKDGRTQRPVFLRDHVEEGIDDLLDRMEAELGEDVYKTDVTEAAMAVAEENPELVLAKLEEWGYGWT